MSSANSIIYDFMQGRSCERIQLEMPLSESTYRQTLITIDISIILSNGIDSDTYRNVK